jgi:hypothetical protein
MNDYVNILKDSIRTSISMNIFKNKEDAQYLNMNAHPEELPQVVRASQAWANDLENIPVFWVLGGICIALNLSTRNRLGK